MTPTSRHVPEHLREIILRFLEGTASDEDVKILLGWLKEDKKNREYFDEVNTTFQASVTLNRFTQQRTDDAWGDLFNQIDIQGSKTLSLFPYKLVLKIAASLSMVALGWIGYQKITSREFPQQQSYLVKTVPGNNTRILLPDSSIVWLNTNSTLEYPPSFGTTSREVVLKGEAFFDIRKGSKPFIVKTDDIQIQVKGTKFNVQAYRNEHTVKTTLQEGKVELRVTGKDKVYTMKPGDQVILNTEYQDVTVNTVDPADFTAWKEEKLVFDNSSLADIILKLENRFRVNITTDSLLATKERFSMTIEHESLDEVLDMIQLSSHLKVNRDEDDITLYE